MTHPTYPTHLASSFSADGPREWDRPAAPRSCGQVDSPSPHALALGPIAAPEVDERADDGVSNVVVLPMSVVIERERVPRRVSSKPAPAEFQVGDVVVASPVGAGTITSFTERGVPRVKHVAVAWLERDDGAVHDPQQRRR